MNSVDNIVHLPEEVLITIFEYLIPSDRRVISLCCSKFLDIWLRDIFIGDRRLVLEVGRDLSVLKNSDRNYKELVLYVKSTIDENDDLWMTLGTSVTTIELIFIGDEVHCPTDIFWSKFNNLEIVHLNEERRTKPFTGFSFIPKTIRTICMPTDWLLRSALDEQYLQFNDIIWIKLMHAAFISNPGHIKFIQKYVQNIERLDLRLDDHTNVATLRKLPAMNVTDLHLHLDLDCFSVVDILSSLEERFPALESLSLRMHFVPYGNWKFLKELSIVYEPTNFLQLNMFTNLVTLEIKYLYERNCLFIHETLFVKKSVKSLKLTCNSSDLLCNACLNNLTKSFPAIETLTCFKLKYEHLETLQTNLPKLKSLTLSSGPCKSGQKLSFDHLSHLSEITLNTRDLKLDIENWPMMPHLRSLNGINISDGSEVMIFSKMPALKVLKIWIHNFDKDVHEFLVELSTLCKRLEHLQLSLLPQRCTVHEVLTTIATSFQFVRFIRVFGNYVSKETKANIREEMYEINSSIKYIKIN